MIHRFEDAAFTQEFLLHSINSHGYFSELCTGYQQARYPTMPEGVVRSVVGNALLRADPIYVSADVMELWKHASETFKLEKVRRSDLVIPSGFALLPKPFGFTDRHGAHVKFRAISWLPVSTKESFRWDEGTEGQGVWVSLLSHVDDHDDYWNAKYEPDEASIDRMREMGYTGPVDSTQSIVERSKRNGWDWSLMHAAPVLFDMDIDGYEEGEDPSEVDSVRNVWGIVQCFWRLMGQLVMTQESLPRQARRQRQRAKMIDTVKVMRLRRTRTRQEHEGESIGVEYSHRWIREGHWRNQPYGPKANPTHYRQIWIGPCVCGPEDKPLVIKDRGVEFDR